MCRAIFGRVVTAHWQKKTLNIRNANLTYSNQIWHGKLHKKG